jgi:hypothetical protein
MITRRSVSPRLAAAVLPVALALGGCASPAGTAVLPAAEEQPAVDPVVEEAPRSPTRSFDGSTCRDAVPGTYC